MADKNLINYYTVLRVPAGADLAGIENAYAQLSNELAVRIEVDETSAAELRRVNEAYSVLSHPEMRREYDRTYFASEISREAQALKFKARRRMAVESVLIGALMLIILAQAITIAYIGGGEASEFAGALFGSR